MFDVIIIGGSYVGLAAGTQLARAKRRVFVMDGGSAATASLGSLMASSRAMELRPLILLQ